VNTIAVNQVLDAGASRKFLASKRADQQRALQKLRSDPALRCGARPGTMSKTGKIHERGCIAASTLVCQQ